MRITMVRQLSIAALALGLIAPAFAGEDRSCSPIGTWMGFQNGVASWMVTVEGQTINSGTLVLEVANFDTTLGGMLPTALKGKVTVRGNWVRVGKSQQYADGVGLVVDQDGNTLYIARLYGYRSVVEDCKVVWVGPGLVLALYYPNQNPFSSAEAPFHVMPMQDHEGVRMPVDVPSP